VVLLVVDGAHEEVGNFRRTLKDSSQKTDSEYLVKLPRKISILKKISRIVEIVFENVSKKQKQRKSSKSSKFFI
jgi:hypothetical protein